MSVCMCAESLENCNFKLNGEWKTKLFIQYNSFIRFFPSFGENLKTGSKIGETENKTKGMYTHVQN